MLIVLVQFFFKMCNFLYGKQMCNLNDNIITIKKININICLGIKITINY